jgi:hypothetical protein
MYREEEHLHTHARHMLDHILFIKGQGVAPKWSQEKAEQMGTK